MHDAVQRFKDKLQGMHHTCRDQKDTGAEGEGNTGKVMNEKSAQEVVFNRYSITELQPPTYMLHTTGSSLAAPFCSALFGPPCWSKPVSGAQ